MPRESSARALRLIRATPRPRYRADVHRLRGDEPGRDLRARLQRAQAQACARRPLRPPNRRHSRRPHPRRSVQRRRTAARDPSAPPRGIPGRLPVSPTGRTPHLTCISRPQHRGRGLRSAGRACDNLLVGRGGPARHSALGTVDDLVLGAQLRQLLAEAAITPPNQSSEPASPRLCEPGVGCS
jgi:hypothetical protein